MDEAAVAGLGVRFSVLYDPALVDNAEALCGALGEARALIVRNRTRVTAPLLTAAPHLEVVGRLGVGLDNIDMAACRARGLQVFPATRSEEHTSELQSRMRISYAVFCLKKKIKSMNTLP